MNQIGKINIAFDVFSNSSLYLAIMDLSEWRYSEDKPSYISITMPGSKKPKTFSFKKYKTNIFNSHNLGISCLKGDCTEETYVDLPDGIYTIKVMSGFENIDETKYYLKTDRFEIEYQKVLIAYGINVDQNFINFMTKVKYILDVAKSHTMDGNFVEAHKDFQEAKKLLKRFAECRDCLGDSNKHHTYKY